LLKTSLQIDDSENISVSIYSGEASTKCVMDNLQRVRMAFPSLPSEFYDILSNRIIDKRIGDKRLIDAVNHVIDNCIYPTPTIANFITFDKRVKLFAYEQMVKKAEEFGGMIWESYKAVEIPGSDKKVWVHVKDLELMGFEIK